MNLTEQTVSGTNQVSLQDSLNASLMKLKITMGANVTQPADADLYVYVDKASQENPTEEKKQYLFDLDEPLRYFGSAGDELLQEIKIVNNDVVMETTITRKIGVNEEGANYVLETPSIKKIDAFPVTLFEGANYIYTNYSNASIELIYTKDTVENRTFLNNAMYYNHKLKNDGEFSLDDIYFKDAFTKTENKLNLEVNNANLDCITSRNNKFSLDSDGNLIVNSITTVEGGNTPTINNDTVCNLIYPIGSIYISTNSTNPGTLFGGTWEQIKGRFLLGQGNNTSNTTNYWGVYDEGTCNFPNGEMGGEANHKLTLAEMPSHNHTGNTNEAGWHTHTLAYKGFSGLSSNTNGWYLGRRNISGDSNDGWWDATNGTGNHTHSFTTNNSGGDNSHNNMPPYLVVYMWKRVS